MMKNKQFTVMYGLIIILSVTLIIGLVIPKGNSVALNKDIAPAFDGSLDTLEQISLGKDLVFSRINGTWFMDYMDDKFPANAGRLESLAKSLKNLEVNGVASLKKETWTDFMVDDNSALKVQAKGKKGETTWYLSGPGSQGTYLRLGGDDRVYAISQGLEAYQSQKPSYWGDCDWIHLDKAAVDRIILKSGSRSLDFSLSNDQGIPVWKDKSGKILKSDDADTLVRNYTNSNINEMLVSPDLQGLVELYDVTLFQGEKSGSLKVYGAGTSGTWVVIPGDGRKSAKGMTTGFRIDPWMAGNVILEEVFK